MKVAVKPKRNDVYVGDIILFDKKPCMVIDMGDMVIDVGEDSDNYGILSLDEVNGGDVLEIFKTLHGIDNDSRTNGVLISRNDVVITKKEGAEVCPF